MRRRIWILLTLAALTLVTVGIMSGAGADEALADGIYSLTVPGVGEIAFTVTDGTVALTPAPDGFTLVASESDDGEFVLASDAMTIEVEVEDGTLQSEVKVDLGELSEGEHDVTIGDYTFTIIVGEDGSLSMDQPEGFTLETDDESLKLTDGSIVIEIKAEDGRYEASISAAESDDELSDTESDDDELSDSESDDELSDHESDQKSDDDKSDDHESDHDSKDHEDD